MVMKFTKLILFFLLLTGTFSVQAQSRLDQITFSLPDSSEWTEVNTRFKNDSTQFSQQWGNKADSLILVIRSSEKAELEKTFEEMNSQTQNKFDTLPLEKGLIAQQYAYTLYNVDLAKLSAIPASGLLLIMETPTTIHMVIFGQSKQAFSQEIINKWTKILTHPVVELSNAQPLKRTRIVLETSKPELLTDITLRKRLMKSFKNRLVNIYDRNITPRDIRFDREKIYLTLRGNVDQELVVGALTIEKDVAILPVFSVKEKSKFIQKINRLSFPDEEPKEAGATMKKQRPVLTLVTAATKDTVRGFIKKYLQKHQLGHVAKIFKSSNYTMIPTELYLLNTTHKLADETNIMRLDRAKVDDTPVLKIHLDEKVREKMKQWTRQNQNGYLAIVIDGRVYATPKIQGVISDGIISVDDKEVSELFYIYYALADAYPIPITVQRVKPLN